WLQQSRVAAWDTFETTPLPRLERTDLTKFNFADFGLTTDARGDLPEDIRAAIEGSDGADRAGLFVQSNGEIIHVSLDSALARRGVVLTSLAEAAQTHSNLVRRHLGRVIPAREGKFPALNAALWTGGLFLYIPRNVVVEAPIQIVF